MSLITLGLNHHTAPLVIRERVAFAPDSLQQALSSLAKTRPVREAVIISTCNRTELICATDKPEEAAHWLADFQHVPLTEISPFLYSYPDHAAVRHIFRVACGLDSMVLGETQILGQIKEAARQAESAGTMGGTLHKLFQHSFSVAKHVRTHTTIGVNIVSMASAAVDLSARIFEKLSDSRVLFIGAGEMIALCAAHFAGVSPRSITITNRTPERAQLLAQRVQGNFLPFESLGDALHNFDVIISCTASPLPILGYGTVERALRARRRYPMVMVDLAVPRDIEPEVKQLSDIFLYTIDDLAQIVETGKESRQAAVVDAEKIINEGVKDFLRWIAQRDVVPTIRSLRQQGETLRQEELARALRLLAKGGNPEQVLQALSQGLVNKLLHAPTQFLSHAEGEDIPKAVDTVQQLFNLDTNTPLGPHAADLKK